jgi:hypothetical protein
LGTTTDVLNVTFSPNENQRRTVQALPLDLQRQTDRLQKLTAERLASVRRTVREAGVEVRP